MALAGCVGDVIEAVVKVKMLGYGGVVVGQLRVGDF